MYDISVRSSLPTSAILVLGLLKKTEKADNEHFWMGSILEYLALHKRLLAVLNVATNVDTTVENAYTVKSAWKCETAKKNWRFCRDCLWDAILHNGARFQSILAFL